MKLKKLLALSLAAVLSVGMAVSASAAELDTTWYAANNPDVVAVLGSSAKALRTHYDKYGRKEGRMANSHDVEAKLRKLFDAKEYAALYPDVKAAFGDDAEAMFQHYISYGLLETRRPCEKVSYEAAVALKEAVVKAVEKAGLEAVPGSAEVVAVLEGDVDTVAVESVATVEALTQASAEVEKAVEAAVTAAEAPVSAAQPTTTTSNEQKPATQDKSEIPPVVNPDVGNEDPGTANTDGVIVANLVDADNSEINDALAAVKENITINYTSGVENYHEQVVTYTLVTAATSGETKLLRHSNGTEVAYWFGIGVPSDLGKGVWGFAENKGAALEILKSASIDSLTNDNTMTYKGKEYNTYYWGWNTSPMEDDKKWGYLMVKSDNNTITNYVIDFSGIALDEIIIGEPE